MLQEQCLCKSTFKIMEGGREVFRGILFQNMFGNTAQRASGDFARYCRSFSRTNAFAELGQNGIFVIIAQMESITFGEKRDFLRQFAVAS